MKKLSGLLLLAATMLTGACATNQSAVPVSVGISPQAIARLDGTLKAGMNDLPGAVGEYLWGGAGGTWFWIDPTEKLIAIFMSQRPGDPRIYYRRLTKNLVAQTLR